MGIKQKAGLSLGRKSGLHFTKCRMFSLTTTFYTCILGRLESLQISYQDEYGLCPYVLFFIFGSCYIIYCINKGGADIPNKALKENRTSTLLCFSFHTMYICFVIHTNKKMR